MAWRGIAFIFSLLTLFSFCQGYITWIEKRYPLPGTPSPPGSPWPMPQIWSKSENLASFDPDTLQIKGNISWCNIIEAAVNRYKTYFFPGYNKTSHKPDSSYTIVSEINISVYNKTCPTLPRLNDDENYDVSVVIEEKNAHVDLLAPSVWGLLRALETFTQLIWQDDAGVFVINETSITDYPRFAHRGILLDTARHFQPISVIKKNLDAMEWNKMNVFHWHIVDDQSFPFESKMFANLSTLGAYSPHHIYTQEDIQDVIEYAKLRGIRVILEFDTPGHTMGFAKAFPQLLTPCYGDGKTPGTPNYHDPGRHADYEILDPTNNFTFWFMEQFFTEVKQVLQDDYVHLGMDEVYYGCWNSSPIIKQFMQDKGFTDLHEVEQFYVEWMIKMVERKGFKYITWQDPVDNGVKMADDTIIHVWKDKELDSKMKPWREYIVPIAKKGYNIILSACWYLNYISYGQDWKKYYECDPQDFEGGEERQKQMIGGEACLWGEYVDGTNLLPRLWPRASAVAERLWSNRSVNSTDDAAFRLDQQRCRMLRRGIPTQPILNGFCDWGLKTRPPTNTTQSPAEIETEPTVQDTTKAAETETTTKGGNNWGQSLQPSTMLLLFLKLLLLIYTAN